MTTRIVQANKAELSFGSRPHHRRHRCRSPWRLDALNRDFSAISVRQMEFCGPQLTIAGSSPLVRTRSSSETRMANGLLKWLEEKMLSEGSDVQHFGLMIIAIGRVTT
jgi:hypothetical protein